MPRICTNNLSHRSPADFLGLSLEESAFVELKVRLSESLRERHHSRKLSQEALAKKIKSSQSRVAKTEAGDPSVSIDLLIRALLATGRPTETSPGC